MKAKIKNTKPTQSSAPESPVNHELIAACAHQIWEREGRPEGRALGHWLQAETQIWQTHPPGAA